MASKNQEDLDAKMARIRAANEERERRHREVLADRLEAEKSKSAVNVKSAESGTKPVESEERFRSPFDASPSGSSASKSSNKKPAHERLANSKSQPSREEPARRGRGRLADDDGPPPDPGYSFLADRMRDGSPEDDDSRKNKNNRPPKRDMRRPAGVGGGNSSSNSRPSYQEENVSPKHKSRSKIEESVGQRLREIRDDSSSSSSANSKTSHIKPLMPESFMAKARSAGGSAQARLDRSRHQRDQNGSSNMSSSHQYVDRYGNANRKVISGDGRKDLKVKVNFDRSDSQPDADDDWNDEVGKQAKQQQQQQHHHQPQQQQAQPLPLPQQLQPLSATTPSFTPLEQQNQWQPMPIGDWDPNQSTMVIGT